MSSPIRRESGIPPSPTVSVTTRVARMGGYNIRGMCRITTCSSTRLDDGKVGKPLGWIWRGIYNTAFPVPTAFRPVLGPHPAVSSACWLKRFRQQHVSLVTSERSVTPSGAAPYPYNPSPLTWVSGTGHDLYVFSASGATDLIVLCGVLGTLNAQFEEAILGGETVSAHLPTSGAPAGPQPVLTATATR